MYYPGGKTGRTKFSFTGSRNKLQDIVNKQYADFCIYRTEVFSYMPDYKRNRYVQRRFDGQFFEVI